MAMRALIIGEKQRQQIAELIKLAHANPIEMDAALLEEIARDPPKWQARQKQFELFIPHGFKVVYTREIQHNRLIDHISVSVDKPGKLPNEHAVALICAALDLDRVGDDILQPRRPDDSPIIKLWLEEFDPGHKAVNIQSLAKVK